MRLGKVFFFFHVFILCVCFYMLLWPCTKPGKIQKVVVCATQLINKSTAIA